MTQERRYRDRYEGIPLDTLIPNHLPVHQREIPDAENIGKWLGVLNQYIGLGWFSKITVDTFSDAPKSIIRTAQRQAFITALEKLFYQRQQLEDPQITIEMRRVIEQYDEITQRPRELGPSVDAENWQPIRDLNIHRDVDEGRYRDITLGRYPDFNDHPEQLALHRLRAMGVAADNLKNGRIVLNDIGITVTSVAAANKGLSKYENQLAVEMVCLIESVFGDRPDYSLLV